MLSSKFVHELSDKPFTLQEVLRRHGYRVHLVLGGDHSNFYGFRELYGAVDSYYDGSMRHGMYMNDDELVLEKVGSLRDWDGVPVMMQFHLMSAHGLGKRHPRYARFSPSASYVVPQNREPPLVDNYYDNGVVQADAVIHELLAMLGRKHYLQNTLVVITADHGESLGEGGRYTHAHGVDDESLRIPLLLIAHGYQPRPFARDDLVASQVDIAPTILAEFDMSAPSTWSGLALQDPVKRAFTYFQEGHSAGLIDQRDPQNLWKYWLDQKSGREYAYNLTLDPAERSNRIAAVAESLRRDWRRQYLQLQAGSTETASAQ